MRYKSSFCIKVLVFVAVFLTAVGVEAKGKPKGAGKRAKVKTGLDMLMQQQKSGSETVIQERRKAKPSSRAASDGMCV